MIYKNLGGDSNVSSYEIGEDFIIVYFKGSSRRYRYSYNGGAGKNHVDTMKKLAQKGEGLNSYIITRVNKLYDKKY